MGKHYTKAEKEEKANKYKKIQEVLGDKENIKIPKIIKSPELKKMYKDISKELNNRGFYRNVNSDLIIMYINNIILYYKLCKILNIDDKDDLSSLLDENECPSAFIKEYIKLQSLIYKQNIQLGLDPQTVIKLYKDLINNDNSDNNDNPFNMPELSKEFIEALKKEEGV